MPRYKRVKENGIKFVFKYDDQAPDLLHIYARHLTTIDDALDLFFDQKAVWNRQFQRYENNSDTHGLYWFWLNQQDRIVMIVSAFENNEGFQMKKRRNYEDLGDVKLDPEASAKVERMIAEADEEDELARVNFRWSKDALDVVKQAAELMGIPYQTFIKQSAFEHALSIIKDMEATKKTA